MTRDYITVVSGIPRSGTSLMMRMLEAGGIPALTDQIRQGDAHNPRGYYEYEPVKRLGENSLWIESARGKGIKIIYRLLCHLPPSFEYRVIFMERDLREVFASQSDMLRSRGVQGAEQNQDRLIAAFAAEVEEVRRWLAVQPNVQTLFASYNEIVRDPAQLTDEVSRFLGGDLDTSAMARVVEPQLYRHRSRQ